MRSQAHAVYVVDDDHRMREALVEILAAMSFTVEAFPSATDYLRFLRPDVPSCLILDIQLPDTNGLELQKQISGLDHPPIIFITGYGDIESSVEAIKGGAIDFLPKPVAPEKLLHAIAEALRQDGRNRMQRAESIRLKSRFALLTPREQEVLPWLAGGYLNKQAAAELGISLVTVQVHRGRIMKKMGAGSFADLVRMAGKLDVVLPCRETS